MQFLKLINVTLKPPASSFFGITIHTRAAQSKQLINLSPNYFLKTLKNSSTAGFFMFLALCLKPVIFFSFMGSYCCPLEFFV